MSDWKDLYNKTITFKRLTDDQGNAVYEPSSANLHRNIPCRLQPRSGSEVVAYRQVEGQRIIFCYVDDTDVGVPGDVDLRPQDVAEVDNRVMDVIEVTHFDEDPYLCGVVRVVLRERV